MHPVAHPSARCFILFPTSGFFARASSLSLSLSVSLSHTPSQPREASLSLNLFMLAILSAARESRMSFVMSSCVWGVQRRVGIASASLFIRNFGDRQTHRQKEKNWIDGIVYSPGRRRAATPSPSSQSCRPRCWARTGQSPL